VADNGALLVSERIQVFFFGDFTFGYRDIPLRPGESIDRVTVSSEDILGNSTRYTGNGSPDKKSNLTPDTFGVKQSSGQTEIVWHFAPSSGSQTYIIGYRFRGLTKAYSDVADVNLKVWGDQWAAPLSELNATLTLPRPTALNRTYRVWAHPAWVKGVVTRLPDSTTLQAVDVPSHQFVEIHVVFPRRLLRSTAGAQTVPGPGLAKIVAAERADAKSYLDNQAKIDDAKHHILRTIGYLLLIGLAPALVVIALIWLVWGRERRADYDREYEQQPPDDTAPALVPPLLRQGFEPGSLELTATLFDLIRRGYYKSKPVTTEHDSWGGLKKEQVSDLELSAGEQTMDLEPWEQSVAEVFDSVLITGPERLSNMRDRIKADRTANAERFKSFKSEVASAIRSKKWYMGTGAAAIWVAAAGFIAAAIILIAIPASRWRSASPRWTDIVILAIGICMVVNAGALIFAFLHAKLWRRRTKTGELEAQRWHAFRHYLTDFPRLQDAVPATLQLWEKYLVYGIAFGIAERVLQAAHLQMPKEMADQSTIYWISPNV